MGSLHRTRSPSRQRSTFLFGALVATQLATAATWVQIPRLTDVMPSYFSGTNCRATGGLVSDDGHHPLTDRMELRINGTIVNTWPKGQGLEDIIDGGGGADGIPPPAELAVMFDSTQFEDGTQIVVEFELWTKTGQHYYGSRTAPVYNKCTLYGRYDQEEEPLTWWGTPPQYIFGNLADVAGLTLVAQPTLEAMNYGEYRFETHLGWSAASLLEDCKFANVFQVHTHANDSNFWSDADDYHIYYPNPPGPYPAGERIWPLGDHPWVVGPARVAANGSGWPPYNSTGLPPVNLAFLDTCDAGTDNLFAEAFLYPQGNAYTGGPTSFPENQAECGFTIIKFTDWTVACNEAFWGALAQTYTVHEARLALWSAYGGTNRPDDPRDFLHVWGDWNTRLKGVYTGAPGQQFRWYFDGGGLPLDETHL